MKRIIKFKITAATLIVCFILLVIQVLIRNYDSTYGKEYDELNSTLKDLEVSNSLISRQVASQSSILAISQKAESYGFLQNQKIVSFYGPQPLAAAGNTL